MISPQITEYNVCSRIFEALLGIELSEVFYVP
jgi:hypothetical protein